MPIRQILACALLSLASCSLLEGFSNAYLVEALMRNGNFSQAYMVLSREGEQGPVVDLYRGAVLLGLDREEEGLRWMEVSQAEAPLHRFSGLEATLLEFVTSRNSSSRVVSRLRSLAPESGRERWLAPYLKALQREGNHAQVILEAKSTVSVELLPVLAQSYKIEGQIKSWLMSLKGSQPQMSPEMRYQFLRLWHDEMDQAEALLMLQDVPEVEGDSFAELLTYLGKTQQRPDLLERGYRMRFRQAPLDLSRLRDFVSFLYAQERRQEAEAILLEMLTRTANSIALAREIAQIFLDHGAEDKLLQFVEAYRIRTGSPRMLSDVLLHSLGSRRMFPELMQELKERHGPDAFILGERAYDYVPESRLGDFSNFLLSSQGVDAVRMILALVARQGNRPSLARLLAAQPAQTLQLALHSGLERNYLQAVSYVLSELSPVPESLVDLQVRVAFRKQDYQAVDQHMVSLGNSALATDPELSRMWFFSLIELPGNSKEVVRLGRNLGLVEQLSPDLEAHWLRHMIQAGQTSEASLLRSRFLNLTTADLQYLDFLTSLKRGELAQAHTQSKALLSTQMSSPWLVQVQGQNLILSTYRDYLDSEVFTVWAELEIKYLAGDQPGYQASVARFEQLTPELDLEQFVLEMKVLSQLRLLEMHFRLAHSRTERDEIDARWCALGREMFEKFPDSFYTPQVARGLFQRYREQGRDSDLRSFLTAYLKNFPSDLTAQVLRGQHL